MEYLDLAPATRAAGTLRLPGSKSISNRTLLLAALARGDTELSSLLDSDDTRVMREALRELGVTIEIGPDAHSTAGLDNVHFGIGMARKAWLEAGEILNTRSPEDILAFAQRRRALR